MVVFQIFMYTRGTRNSVKTLGNTNNSTGTGSPSRNKDCRNPFKDVLKSDIFPVERKLALRLLAIVFVWLLGWTPFTFVAIMQLSGYGQQVSKYVSLLSMIFCKTSSVINAYIYGMR